MSSVTACFSTDERLSEGKFSAGRIRCILFQSGSDGNIFLPPLYFDMALRIYDARRTSNSKYPPSGIRFISKGK